MLKFNMAELLPIITEAIEKGDCFKLPITGTSMNPLLKAGRDYALLEKASLPLSVGDVPLYRRSDGDFVLHRVMNIDENGAYVMCGDNQFVFEYGITDENIIAVAKGFIINGEEIDAFNNGEYLEYKSRCLKNVGRRHPVAQLKYKIKRLKDGK